MTCAPVWYEQRSLLECPCGYSVEVADSERADYLRRLHLRREALTRTLRRNRRRGW